MALMFRIRSEGELLGLFRTRDRKHVELPPGLTFPRATADHLTWVDPAGVRAFLVFRPEGARLPVGIVFRRDQQGGLPAPAAMCEWCHHSGTTDEIGLLTADVGARRRVGVHACLDLGCKRKVEDAANRTGRSALQAVRAVSSRMSRFVAAAFGDLDAVRE